MAESDSLHNSSYSNSDLEESTSTYLSTEASEDLYLSLPAEVSPYRFEPVYDEGEEPSPVLYPPKWKISESVAWVILIGKYI